MKVTFANLTPASDEALDERAHEIADDLIGTAYSQHDFMTQEEIDDPALQAKLTDLCFECDGCGWWASTEELHNDGPSRELCDECYYEEDQDDDED